MKQRLLIGAFGLLLVSCSADRPESAPIATPARSPQPHWVQDEQLRKAMGTLADRTRYVPDNLPDDPEDPAVKKANEAFTESIQLGEALARTAEQIPGLVAHVQMPDDVRRDFAAAAANLKTQALGLKQAAERRQVERMQIQLSNITGACTLCHTRFRDFTGDLWLRKAEMPVPKITPFPPASPILAQWNKDSVR
jgi:cytochrome c556